MSERKPQTLANHGRLDEAFHFFILPVLALNFLVALYFVGRHPGFLHVWIGLVSLALLLLALKSRMYSVKMQDRLIRLEERLRLAALLAEPLRARIYELSEGQLIALRFASDGEIPALVERTLREGLGRKDIKKLIQNWRPDYWRV